MPDLIAFAPPPGIVSDDTSFAAQGRWADGNNVRFWGGKAQPVGSPVADPGYSGFTATGTPRALFYPDVSGRQILGTSSKLYDGTTDISPAGLGTGYSSWGLASFGSIVMAAPGGGKLYQSATAGAQATLVTQAPAQINWMLVTPERQVLAFGCNQEIGGAFNGRCIRGSDLEDFTNWTTTASDNVFEHVLDGANDIVTARMIGRYVAVWTRGELYMGQFIGDPGQTYRFDRIDEAAGIIGPNAACIANGRAYWVGPDGRLRVWQPGLPVQIIPCPVFKDYNDNIQRDYSALTIVSHVTRYSEIWIWYPDKREGTNENSRYIAYSLGESLAAQQPVWFRGQLARSAVLDSLTVQAVLSASGYVSSTVAADSAGHLWIQERGTLSAISGWYIQSADQYIEEGQRRVMIRGVRPDFLSQSGDISLTLNVRGYPQAAAVAKGPYTLSAGAKKKDFRASGSIMSVRLAPASNSFVRLGKLEFDTIPMGER